MSGQPYTHADHAQRCREAAQDRVVLIQFVQVRRRHVTLCARIREAFTLPDGVDLWRVELLYPGMGLVSVSPKLTRQCSGLDDLCRCAGEAGVSESVRRGPACGDAAPDSAVAVTPNFCQAGVVAPPDSPGFGNFAGSEG